MLLRGRGDGLGEVSEGGATEAVSATQMSSSGRVDGWGVGLNWMSTVVQAIWSFNDLLLDDGALTGSGDPDNPGHP
jgi:hypothetical protein